MQAMVDATLELLRDRSPDALTVREIAERAGHHHRFVAGWFGSKAGLLRTTFDQMASALATDLVLDAPPPDVGPRPEVVRLLRLLNWLATHDPQTFDDDRPTPLVDRIAETYATQFGLPGDLARLSAQRLSGYFVLTVLYPGPFGVRPEDFDAQLALEARIVRCLVEDQPAETT